MQFLMWDGINFSERVLYFLMEMLKRNRPEDIVNAEEVRLLP